MGTPVLRSSGTNKTLQSIHWRSKRVFSGQGDPSASACSAIAVLACVRDDRSGSDCGSGVEWLWVELGFVLRRHLKFGVNCHPDRSRRSSLFSGHTSQGYKYDQTPNGPFPKIIHVPGTKGAVLMKSSEGRDLVLFTLFIYRRPYIACSESDVYISVCLMKY